MYFVYILKSELLDSYYVGHTKDLKRRVMEHNMATSRYSSKTNDWKTVWCSAFIKRKQAINFERYLKSSSDHAFRNKRLV